jgi:hypothetical protein
MISTWKQELMKRASELFARGVDDAADHFLRDWVAKSDHLVPISPTLTA